MTGARELGEPGQRIRTAPRQWRIALLALLFFLSGSASLLDQVVWLRYLSLTFGNTTYAAATLLAVFMAGLGFGAILFGRLADRSRRPLIVYALLETGIALFAIVSPRLFELIDGGYVLLYRLSGSQPLLFAAGRVLLAAVCLLPPTLLMGGTLPFMLRAVSPRTGEVGRLTAVFYSVNTLGATAGVALAGFVTIRLLGLWSTLLIAAAANLIVALGCVALSAPLRLRRTAASATSAGGRTLLLVFFLMGATSLAYEVLWTRILVFHLGSSVYAYSLMLFIFLLGVGAGSLIIARGADRLRSPLAALAVLEIAIGLLALVEVALFGELGRSLRGRSERIRPRSFTQATLAQLLGTLPILGPPTLLMGVSFPLAVRGFSRRMERLGADVGAVYGANTVGSIAGALAAGFVAIPLLGSQNSLLVVGGINTLLGAVLWNLRPVERRAASGRLLRGSWLLAPPTVCLVALALLPADRVILGAGIFHRVGETDLVHFDEDASSSVAVVRRSHPRGSYLSLELNGVNVAGTSPDLFAVQKMQGHLPLLLASEVEKVLHIGFGSGGTAHAVSLHPVDSIFIVEISRHVLEASNRFFLNINHGVLADPRAEIEVNDGRNLLLATPRIFDAILSDSIHPRFAGNGSLYTLDYFRLIRRRLSPDGVVSMWLPMYSITPRNFTMILRAFSEVFPTTAVWYEPSAINAFTIVTGKVGPQPWHRGTLERAFADPRIAEALKDLGITGPAELLACYLLGGSELDRWLGDVPPHVDDLPAVEYESGTLLERERPWLINFARLLAGRPDDPPATYLAVLPEEERRRAIDAYRGRLPLLQEHARALERRLRGAPRQLGTRLSD